MMTLYVSPRRRARLARWSDARRADVHIPVDVIVEDDAYVISAFVPGIPAENIEIEVLDDTVSIRGEFERHEDEDLHYLRRERPTGSFSRVLRLPAALDAAGAKADVEGGILTLHVPQAEHAKTKKISIKAK